LSTCKRRPLGIEQDTDLAKDRADTKLKKFILYSAIPWVIDVDFNRSLAQEVDVFALRASLYKHIFWLAELGRQLFDQIIKIIHIFEANITLLDFGSNHRIVSFHDFVEWTFMRLLGLFLVLFSLLEYHWILIDFILAKFFFL